MSVTLKQMRYALALATTGHFGRAAEACHVTQSALSQQIKLLERTCGALLFVRGTGLVRPTALGHDFLESAAQIVQQADRLVNFARGGSPARPVRFGLIPTIAPYLLPHIYPVLRAQLPSVDFAISERRTEHLLSDIDSGAIDLGLIATEPPPDAPLVTAPLFADPFVLATRADEDIKEPVAMSSLPSDRILLLDEGHCFRDQAIAACGMRGPEATRAFAATSLSTIVEFVANGQGMTLLPAISLKKEVADGRIAIHALAAPGASRMLALVWHTASPFGATFEAIADIIRTEGQAGLANRL